MSRTSFPAWMGPCLTVRKGDVTPMRYEVLLNLSPEALAKARALANTDQEPRNRLSRKNVRRSIVAWWKAMSYACLTGPCDPDRRDIYWKMRRDRLNLQPRLWPNRRGIRAVAKTVNWDWAHVRANIEFNLGYERIHSPETPFQRLDRIQASLALGRNSMKDLNIDWPLFHRQKAMLVAMADDKDRLTSEVEVLDGVINLMDGIQDALEPDKPEDGSIPADFCP